MKKILLITLVLLGQGVIAQKNIVLRAHYKFPSGVELSNICGYAANGREYALVGTSLGTTIVDVTNPDSPVKLFDIPSVNSIWREIKTYKEFAYVTTEGNNAGLQIVDMTNLPAGINIKVWKGDSIIQDKLLTIHALHIDNGVAYLYGTNRSIVNGFIMADLTDPWNPHYVGKFSQFYVHDGYVRRDTVWACAVYDGYFGVIDVKDKANPQVLATKFTPDRVTHNSWLSDNSKTLFTTDETDSAFLTSYDVRDVNNIQELDRIRIEPTKGAIIHNTHILKDYAINSWYKEGVAIVDVSRPDNMVMVGNYDTSPLTGGGYGGAWGVYPFLPSGNLLISDISEGLYVLTPTYKRGCYLEGVVRDSTTGLTLMDVGVEIMGQPYKDKSRLNGDYKAGTVDAGTYSVKYSKQGYITRTLSNIALNNGVVTNKNVKLLAGANAVRELQAINEWSITTDAVTQQLKISFNPSIVNIAPYHVIIVDVLGKTVAALQENPTETSIIYSTAQLKAGVYLVQIEQAGAIIGVQKILLH